MDMPTTVRASSPVLAVFATAISVALEGCVITPPRPSMWQLEARCASAVPFDRINDCTQSALYANYGSGWATVPQANDFVAFIAATAEKVKAGAMTEVEGQQTISNYAVQQSAQVQAQRSAELAEQRQAMAQLGLALMAQSQQTAPAKLMAFGGPDHKTYLGCVNCGDYAADSVSNEYGTYGSAYSVTSVRNEFGQFGSQYSLYSACNPYASDPPVVVDNAGDFYGRLTINNLNPEQIKNPNVLSWLASVCRH